MLGLNFKYEPNPIKEWLKSLTPVSGQPEIITHVLYDTQAYAAAGQTQLSFFTNLPAGGNFGITNMQTAGTLPNPQYFQIQKVFVDMFANVSTNAGVAGSLNDILLGLYTSRPTLTLTISDKQYGPWPVSFFGSSGRVSGNLSSTVATANLSFGQQGDNGGYPINGSLIIPPATAFNWIMKWQTAQAITVETQVRVSMLGNLARRVS